MQPSAHPPSTPVPPLPPQRALGAWMCVALVVGNLIGSGIFMLPAALAPYGWNAVFGWLLTIAGAVCLAWVFAQLARRMPLAGGPCAWVDAAFGPVPAFVIAWAFWISIVVGNAAIATAAVSYASMFIPALATVPGLGAVTALGLMWTLVAVNSTSVRAAGSVQLATTALKLVPLVIVIVIAAGLLVGGQAELHTPLRREDIGLASITAAAAITLWAMLGVESAALATGKVRDPERTVPRATLIGTLLVGGLYLATSVPVMLLMPQEQIAASNFPFADFVARFWGSGAGMLLAAFAVISAAGALNGWILLQGEIPLAMARQGVFPRWFAGGRSHGDVSLRAQLLSAALCTVLIAANYSRTLAGLFLFMALLSTVASLVLYLACSLAALRLQRQRRLPALPGLAVVASLAALYALWTLVGAGAEAVGWGAVLLLSGLPVYALMRRGARAGP